MRLLSTVEKAIDILFCISEEENGLSVTKTAQKLGHKKSTTHQLLASLKYKGLIDQDSETKRYMLSPRVVMLSRAYLKHLDLPTTCLPILKKLRDISKETVVLNMRSGGVLIHVLHVEGLHGVRRVAEIGGSIPLYQGSAGKVILAFLKASDLVTVLERFKANGHFSSPKESMEFFQKVENDLPEIRKKGYAMNLSEGPKGAHFLSAPVFNAYDQPVGCVSMSGPGNRFTASAVKKQIDPMLKAANDISQAFGSGIYIGKK